ncbi:MULTISPECIES: FUSC family protein [Streptomyces]|uniref:FUSC family protein n=1 Tax=Streptomyces TaxID=1883 RepID=UPI0029BCFC17|nr:FUSC family protein [Streptomyces europaeiscabiei]MDX3781457.1 FUSC family protein [Streptomyces europaeiscabiei]
MARSRTTAALRTWLAETWPLVQATAAATLAWVIAVRTGDHDAPFFAPIAAVVALNFGRGERGRNALRLLLGVCIGIAIGECTVVILGSGWDSLALATFVALVIAQALGANRLMRVQAAAGAILTIAAADGGAGVNRLTDALIGAGVALVFTQVLFPPEPLALVRRAERAALATMAEGLRLAAEAIERGTYDEELHAGLIGCMSGVREHLAEVGRAGPAGARVAGHSLIWRYRRPAAAWTNQEAAQIQLLGASCLMLMRTAVSADLPGQDRLAQAVRELAAAITDLSTDLGSHQIRQRAVDRAFTVARRAGETMAPSMEREAATAGVQFLCLDIMVFAGAAPKEASAVLQQSAGKPRAIAPPEDFHLPRLPRRAGIHRLRSRKPSGRRQRRR